MAIESNQLVKLVRIRISIIITTDVGIRSTHKNSQKLATNKRILHVICIALARHKNRKLSESDAVAMLIFEFYR